MRERENAMKRTAFLLAGAALMAMTLGGCYETNTPKQYEPGVYKGSKDPLLKKLEQGELRSRLDERFQTAAQDR